MRILGLVVGLWLVVQAIFAQDMNFYDNNRIGSLCVNAFCQDADNYLWMGTQNGLRRFDGSQFTVYYHSGQDSTSLADNEVHSLLLDREQRLWVGTANGLQQYIPESDNFRLVSLRDVDLRGRILRIIQSDNGELLCIVSNVGLFRIDSQAMVAYPVLTESRVFSANTICALFEDSQKRLWIGTDREGVVCVNLPVKKEKRYALPMGIKEILEDNDGRIWVVTSQSVYCLDSLENRFVPLPYRGKGKGLQYHSAVLTAEGDILIGTYGQGVVCVRRGEKEIVDTDRFRNAFLAIERAKVNTLFEDSHRNVWLGCLYQGVLSYLHHSMPFSFWKSPAASADIPGWINTVFCDSHNRVWCTVEGNGIYQLDTNGNVLRYIPVQEAVFAMYEDSGGTYWIGIDGKGLYSLDEERGRLRLVYPVQGDFDIRCITEDKHQNLYVSILGLGVLCHDLQTGKSRLILEGRWVNTVLCDSEERIWLGHFGNVSCFDMRTHRFVELPFPSDITSSSFFALVEGEDHTIWMATRNGLVHYNPETNDYSVMTAMSGLSDDFIYSLVKDRQGDLWCSTMRGISRIDWNTEKVTNYYIGNGLQENVFLEGRCSLGRDGRVYFGGGSGITCFYPDSVNQVRFDAAPFITDMYVFNRKVNSQTCSGGCPVMDDVPVRATEFHLSYADNTFTLLLSMMDYRDAGGILYEYRLREFGDAWSQTLPGDNRIQYHHLSPGIYTLELRACENGVHSPVKSVQIHITPPWYFSLYAKIFYILFITGVGYLVYMSVIRKRRERIGEMKLQFFINIAHEIRSPLTLILSPLERLLKKENDSDTNRMLLTIRYNTNRILNLLNQLLDIRRIDKGQMKLRFAEVDMRHLVDELLDVFSGEAQRKGIMLQVDYTDRLPSVWIDPNHFDKVLVNLLSNALKYTPQGGSICVAVRTDTDRKTSGPLCEYMEISVSDTGKGIDDKELKKIFIRFYQGEANQASTPLGFGIGLNFCQLLVKLHHGMIYAENRKDIQGSRFVVRLPLGCTHLRKEELVVGQSDVVSSVYACQLETEALPEQEKSERRRTDYRILVIDDDEALCNYLCDSLSVYYRIETAADGKEGWRKAVTSIPDLIVSDVLMPGMDGIRLLKELKKNTNTNHIPIILLTSQTEFADRLEGLTQGADGYLGKPFRLEELNALIMNLITNRLGLKGKFSGNQEQEGKITSVKLPNDDEALMGRVMQVIDAHIDDSLFSVEQLAQEVGMSRSQLFRRMKEMTGLSASDFIRNQRLRQAARLLKEKKSSIAQIAYTVGFANQTHFSTAFKKLYGVTPTEYAEASE